MKAETKSKAIDALVRFHDTPNGPIGSYVVHALASVAREEAELLLHERGFGGPKDTVPSSSDLDWADKLAIQHGWWDPEHENRRALAVEFRRLAGERDVAIGKMLELRTLLLENLPKAGFNLDDPIACVRALLVERSWAWGDLRRVLREILPARFDVSDDPIACVRELLDEVKGGAAHKRIAEEVEKQLRTLLVTTQDSVLPFATKNLYLDTVDRIRALLGISREGRR